jgi:uncharacterized protein
VREAGQGDIMKDYCAGLFYKLGAQGVPKDTTAAMRYYRRTADAGFAAGQMAVGSLYADQGDYTRAKEWYLKASSQNYGDAQWLIGWLYLHGQGVTKSRTEAIKWFRLSAANGSRHGKVEIAKIDAGIDDERKEPAQDLMTEGGRIFNSGNQAAAARPFLAAARAGNSQAQLQIGWHYEKGVGVPQSYSEAALWYRKAADQGVSDAMANLGDMYEFGKGVPEDWVQSAKWLQRSAAFGNALGQSRLGDAYQFGIGVPQNRKLAIYWHQEAALLGNAHSAYFVKRLSNPGNFVGFLNADEMNAFSGGGLVTSVPAEPVGVLFHNSAERMAYFRGRGSTSQGRDPASTWEKQQKDLYEQHKYDTDSYGNPRPCVRTSTGETKCP